MNVNGTCSSMIFPASKDTSGTSSKLTLYSATRVALSGLSGSATLPMSVGRMSFHASTPSAYSFHRRYTLYSDSDPVPLAPVILLSEMN